MRVLALALLAVAALALGAARAEECIPQGEPEVSFGGVYLDNDLCQPTWCLASVWIYEETNGIDGLQRRDHVHDDTCGGRIPADTRVALVYAAPPRL